MRQITLALGLSLTVLTFMGPAELLAAENQKDRLQLDWDKSSWCVQHEGKPVRVQCDKGHPARCLIAPDLQKDGQGLQRIQDCIGGQQALFDEMLRAGVPMEDAIAESPPGWHRDEKGRVFQVTFDLLKRLYLGTAYQPAFQLDDSKADWGRVRFDLGMVASWLDIDERSRHELRALEGYVVLTDLEARALLFGYDMSHRNRRPLMRLTTFFGKPLRHDMFMDLGWGFSLLELQARPHHQKDLLVLEFGELRAHTIFWQSDDLYNYVRLSLSLGAEALFNLETDEDRYALTPGAALQARFGLDRDGFHYLNAEMGWQMPIWLNLPPGESNSRAGIKAGYEVIFLAINDQPLSLVVEAGLDYRDDLGPEAHRFDAQVMAGLRFSLWAPARLHEALPEIHGR